jgi:UDP-N-acetylglucosamine 4,6-dehydratase/5-epimerase
MLTNSSILITGGTGSFGHTFVPMTLAKYIPQRLVIYLRDEMKQWGMAKLYGDDEHVCFFIGCDSKVGYANDGCVEVKLGKNI